MTFHSAILAILLALPVNVHETHHETSSAHLARMGQLASIIEHVANRAACYHRSKCRPIVGDRLHAAAILLAQGESESGFRADVQLGECPATECDWGRARGPWQIWQWPSVPVREWLAYAGADAAGVELGAWRALAVWAGGERRGTGCGYAQLAGMPGACSLDAGGGRRWARRTSLERRYLARLRRKELER